MDQFTKLDDGLKIEEFKSLRSEIVSHIESIHRMETQVVVFAGAVYAFGLNLVEALDLNISKAIFWIPFLLALMNLFRAKERQDTIAKIAGYMRGVEDAIAGKSDDEKGIDFAVISWETYMLNFKRVGGIFPARDRGNLLWRAYLFLGPSGEPSETGYIDSVWRALCIGTFFVAVAYTVFG